MSHTTKTQSDFYLHWLNYLKFIPFIMLMVFYGCSNLPVISINTGSFNSAK